MKTVLVTGATGALGQAVITHLRKRGNDHVIATSRHCDDESGFRPCGGTGTVGSFTG